MAAAGLVPVGLADLKMWLQESQHIGGGRSRRPGWGCPRRALHTRSGQRWAEDKKPEQDWDGGLRTRAGPLAVAPGRQGGRWFVHKVKCWEEDKDTKAGDNVLDLVPRRS